MPVIVGDAILHHADCRDVLKQLPDNSIDSICTDPPYALVSIQKRFGKPGSKPAKDVYGRGAAGFMGKSWDTGEVAFSDEFWTECLRVLKPGGHVVAFSGTRTYHRMAVAIEDAGFEIRDQLGWLYGSGFPKSHDVSKGIDKAAPRRGMFDGFSKHFVERRKNSGLSQKIVAENFPSKSGGITGCVWNWENGANVPTVAQWKILQPLLNLSDEWLPLIERVEAEREVIGETKRGAQSESTGRYGAWGDGITPTAPATAAAREWQGWGTALKPAWEPICLARKPLIGTVAENVLTYGTGALNIDGCRIPGGSTMRTTGRILSSKGASGGAYGNPDHKMERREAVMETGSDIGRWPANIVHDGSDEVLAAFPTHGDQTEARFFYCAKASRKDRDEGLEALPKKAGGMVSNTSGQHITRRDEGYKPEPRANTHPTVKPTALMQWLCRLVTPPGGVILDPFMGSGSTGKAALLEGFRFIGCEREDEYMPIAEARIAAALRREPQQAAPAAQAANDNQQRDLFNVA